MYEVLLSHEAEKYYKRQDKDTKQRLGGLRIVYEINVKNKTVEIKSIRGRGDVYKR